MDKTGGCSKTEVVEKPTVKSEKDVLLPYNYVNYIRRENKVKAEPQKEAGDGEAGKLSLTTSMKKPVQGEAKLTNTKSVTQGEVAKVTDDNFVQDLDCNDYWIDPLMGVRRSSAQVKVCSNAIVAKLAAPSDPGSGLNESETNFEATDHIGKIVENVHGYNKYDEQLVPKHLKPHKLSSQRTSLHLQHLLIENNQLLENIMLMERQLESRKKEISGLKAKLEQMAKSSQIETLGSVNSILNSQDS